MKVGLSLSLANVDDWGRFTASERHEDVPGRPTNPTDIEVWDADIALGLEAEPLGFDSLFVPEHHFTPYSFSTNPLQVLTYFAGRTERIDLGTMVVVLPWHHPLRVAEEAVMLQNLLGDRDLLLGFGRGLARREYEAFGIDMGESRQRFHEAVEIFRLALTEDRFSYRGQHFDIPETSLRPYPRDGRLLDNLYCAWGSPQSAPIAAELGLKPFIIPQKDFAEYEDEMREFAKIRGEHGHDPVQPMFVVWVYCAETEEAALAGAREHMYGYARTPVLHYEIDGNHFGGTKGYEHYAATAQAVEAHQVDLGAVMGQVWIDNHIWGTPEQCVEKIQRLHADWSPSHLVTQMKYGSMSLEEGRQNLGLFASEVLPAVQALPDLGPVVGAS